MILSRCRELGSHCAIAVNAGARSPRAALYIAPLLRCGKGALRSELEAGAAEERGAVVEARDVVGVVVAAIGQPELGVGAVDVLHQRQAPGRAVELVDAGVLVEGEVGAGVVVDRDRGVAARRRSRAAARAWCTRSSLSVAAAAVLGAGGEGEVEAGRRVQRRGGAAPAVRRGRRSPLPSSCSRSRPATSTASL